MDGYPVNEIYIVDANTQEYKDRVKQLDYYLFTDDTIPPGDHTLQINVTNSVSLNLELDYITYIPSFNTLASKPNLSGGGGTPSSETSSSQTGSPPTPKAAIVGVVLGGVTFLVLVILLFLWCRKISRHPSSFTGRGIYSSSCRVDPF